MNRKISVCLLLFLPSAYLLAAGPFTARLEPPASVREWEESSWTLRLEAPSAEGLIPAGVQPPEADKYVRIAAGPVSTSAETEGKQTWTYTYLVRFLKSGNYDLKPFKVLYFKAPPEKTDKADQAEVKPEEQEVTVPSVKVKPRFFWKRMGFWYGALAAFLVLVALYFIISHRKAKGGKKHG